MDIDNITDDKNVSLNLPDNPQTISQDESVSKEKIKEHLSDRVWRLNNLYWITNEHGQKLLFRFNWFQNILFTTLHFLNIVLKARQVGITTFFCILYLDDVLFSKNTKAAIIADSQDHAKKIFQEKIKFPFDNLPSWLKGEFKVNTDSAQMLSFANNSSIEVATSVRSGTYQRLHITEFAKISAKYPEKAREIVTGSLNTVHTGEYISIESTAEGAYGYFYDFFKTAEDNKKLGHALTELDYLSFFFPWWQVPHYRLKGNFALPQQLIKYFNETEIKLDIKIDNEQRNWYWKKSIQQQEDMHREYPSYPEEAFLAATEGSIYGKLVDIMRVEKRIRFVPHDPSLQVDTWWDLGWNDHNVILFTQQYGKEIRIINCYENNHEALLHYVTKLGEYRDKFDYHYRTHNFPHDIAVTELQTGKTRFEYLTSIGLSKQTMRILPKFGLQDGIDAVKRIFNRFIVDESLDRLIKGMSLYRREWDDKLGVFKSEPVHDEWSHLMDALRGIGVGLQEGLENTGREMLEPQNDNLEEDEKYRIFQ